MGGSFIVILTLTTTRALKFVFKILTNANFMQITMLFWLILSLHSEMRSFFLHGGVWIGNTEPRFLCQFINPRLYLPFRLHGSSLLVCKQAAEFSKYAQHCTSQNDQMCCKKDYCKFSQTLDADLEQCCATRVWTLGNMLTNVQTRVALHTPELSTHKAVKGMYMYM